MISAVSDGEGCLIGCICLDEVVLEHIPVVVVGVFGYG